MNLVLDIETLKIELDILKTKLVFFVGLAGGDIYLLINYDKINIFFNQYFIWFVFILFGIYSIVGVIVNFLNINKIKAYLKGLK